MPRRSATAHVVSSWWALPHEMTFSYLRFSAHTAASGARAVEPGGHRRVATDGRFGSRRAAAGAQANPGVVLDPARDDPGGNFPSGAVLEVHMDPHEGRPPTTSRADGSQGFESVALPCLDAVYRFARSLTHDTAGADVLVEETFLRALRSWHTFRPDADCRRWLFAICHRAFLASRERLHARPRSCDACEGDVDALPAGLCQVDGAQAAHGTEVPGDVPTGPVRPRALRRPRARWRGARASSHGTRPR
jgi:DNA-directed RNA polymerase specialized sigma24 family protein